jgi:hypothetical protein
MRFTAALLLLVLFGSDVLAQEVSGRHCFEIMSPAPNVVPGSLVMLNKCTGASWMPYKAPLNDKQGAQFTFTYRWAPLNVDTSEQSLHSGLR